jgi:hypothetical protein
MAAAYPIARVDGFDLDEASVEEAQAVIAAAGVGDRVEIVLRDAADPALAGRYDLVTAFECVHDMSDPVGARGPCGAGRRERHGAGSWTSASPSGSTRRPATSSG